MLASSCPAAAAKQCCWNPCHVRRGSHGRANVGPYFPPWSLSFLLLLCLSFILFQDPDLCLNGTFSVTSLLLGLFPECSTARFTQGLLFNICFFLYILTKAICVQFLNFNPPQHFLSLSTNVLFLLSFVILLA